MAVNKAVNGKSFFAKLAGFAGLLGLFAISASFGYLISHHRGLSEAEQDWKRRDSVSLSPLHAVDKFRVLPLINWHAANSELKTEMGVSYLLDVGDQRILFDVGHNANGESPSPLEHNMARLGISLQSLDAIFISHNHFDHVGGKSWSFNDTFSTGNVQVDLGNAEIYTPVPMTYPGQTPQTTNNPQTLGHGVATTGTIRRQLFMGRIDEQALVVNVKDKGLVVVVGCGHQKLDKLITRVEELFDEPLYGVVGDVHFPVPEGRLNLLGINAQRIFASGDGPWDPLTMNEIQGTLSMLKDKNLGLLAIGSHDSSDEVLELISREFEKAYQKVRVGDWINITPTPVSGVDSSPQ